MKTWVRLPRADPPATADEVSVNEKEIAALTVKLSSLAPSPEIKKQLVDNIKHLLLRGKIALQEASEENLGLLTAALKEVADVLKDYVTGKTSVPQGGSLLRLQTSGGRTASSPALNMQRSAPKVAPDAVSAPIPASPAVNKRPVTRPENCCERACTVSSPQACGAVCRMPASGWASIRRTSFTRQSPLITLSASSTTM